MSDHDLMEKYLKAVLEALTKKSLDYFNFKCETPPTGLHEPGRTQFLRMTEIKNAILSIGLPTTFGVRPLSYSTCPDCTGGVCLASSIGITDKDLADLMGRLNLGARDLSTTGG